MPPLRWLALLVLAAVLLSTQPATPQAPPADVTVRVVKYDGLAEEVAKHRGKVVLVDFWSTTCVPCMKSFPNQVDLYRKHAKDGLVVISVSLNKNDDSKTVDEGIKQRELAFLRKQQATFPNLILDEPWDVVQSRLGFVGIPTIFVFDRQGQWTRFAADKIEHDEAGRYPAIEALVQESLKQK